MEQKPFRITPQKGRKNSFINLHYHIPQAGIARHQEETAQLTSCPPREMKKEVSDQLPQAFIAPHEGPAFVPPLRD